MPSSGLRSLIAGNVTIFTNIIDSALNLVWLGAGKLRDKRL